MKSIRISLLIMTSMICAIGVFTASAEVSTQLDEANANFTYNGKPIHPFLIYKFSNWQSDLRPPMVTTVDVSAAFETNEYQERAVKKNGKWWFAEKKELYDGGVIIYELFGYRWLGRLANGCHVLEVGYSGGGSGFFKDLMIIRFSEGSVLRKDKKERQLLMLIVETYALCDRYNGDIKVYPDKVFIPAARDLPGGKSFEKDVELKFP